ncbi:DUF2147 domain-containing protein [Fibrisoma montanum]|nr:DUF2147 domain-containing protein [Fibrisoma montanum]
MKTILFAATMLFVSVATVAQQLSADKIIGVWEDVDSDLALKFEFYKAGDKYFGKLLYASDMFEADGKTPKKDFKNPDKALQNRSRYGITNITNLTFDKGEYLNGTLYNPDEGRNYSVKVKLRNLNEMDYRAYMGIALLGRSMTFKRVQ